MRLQHALARRGPCSASARTKASRYHRSALQVTPNTPFVPGRKRKKVERIPLARVNRSPAVMMTLQEVFSCSHPAAQTGSGYVSAFGSIGYSRYSKAAEERFCRTGWAPHSATVVTICMDGARSVRMSYMMEKPVDSGAHLASAFVSLPGPSRRPRSALGERVKASMKSIISCKPSMSRSPAVGLRSAPGPAPPGTCAAQAVLHSPGCGGSLPSRRSPG